MLRVRLKNVGPVRAGTVDVGRLTVIVGPNNSGKSVLAMTVYAAVHARSQSAWVHVGRGRGRMRIYFASPWPKSVETMSDSAAVETMQPLLAHLTQPTRVTSSNLDPMLHDRLSVIVREVLHDYGMQLGAELERCFGEKLRNMARTGSGAGAAWVEVASSNQSWAVRCYLGGGKKRIEVLKAPDPARMVERLRRANHPQVDHLRRTKTRQGFEFANLCSLLTEPLFSDLPQGSYYLPAARSGILQSHRALASFVMSRSSLVGIEDMNIPRMSGVITDFIGELLQMETRKSGPYHAIADELEGELLRGQIQVRLPPNGYPEISYRNSEGKFSLHRTSSMVSEIAPVVLFLRNVVNRSDLLIIEEPESHLHPESQTAFGSAIARLASVGLPVMVTTHSDYFLSTLNNWIRRSSVDELQAAERHPALGLRSKDVNAYLLRRSGTGGTDVRRLRVSDQEGIPEDDFSRVAEELYLRSVRLEEEFLALGGDS